MMTHVTSRAGRILAAAALSVAVIATAAQPTVGAAPAAPAPFRSARPAAAPAARAAACAAACRLFTDSASLRQQSPTPFAGPIGGHAETTTIVWNGQHLMYYRTFVSPGGATCAVPQGIALAVSHDGGATWQAENGGRPLPALQTVPAAYCAPSNAFDSTSVYAPDVIADGSRLVMVFEQRDYRANWFGPGQGRALHSVRYVTSTDGRTWSTSTRLLREGAVGAWDDEVGTPDIEKDGSGYVVTFHGHDSTGRLRQGRALVRPGVLVQDYSGPRLRFALSSTPAWADFGIGMGDMTREADGYWYMVFEAFGGASGACGRTDTRTTIGIARSTDARNWTMRLSPLISGRDGRSCGWDMPAWQDIGPSRSIVTPDDPPESVSLVRWNVVDKVPPVPVSGGTQLRQNEMLLAGSTLYAPDGHARLVMQGDGNLVLYRIPDDFVIWASDTDGTGAVRALMQYDGNLVLQRSDGSPVRASVTDGRPGATVQVRGDWTLIDAYGVTVWQRPQPARGM